jgi:hypothetical protein
VQSVHGLRPAAALNWPTLQSLHVPAWTPPQPPCSVPAAHIASQFLQLATPTPAWNWPAAQSLHLTAPTAVWYFPMAQSVQPCQPTTVLCLPAAHGTQLPALAPPQPVCCVPAVQ